MIRSCSTLASVRKKWKRFPGTPKIPIWKDCLHQQLVECVLGRFQGYVGVVFLTVDFILCKQRYFFFRKKRAGFGMWNFGRGWIFGSWKVMVLDKNSLENHWKMMKNVNIWKMVAPYFVGKNVWRKFHWPWHLFLASNTVGGPYCCFIDPSTELTAEFIYQWNSYRFRMSRGPSNLWSFAYMFFPVSLAVPWRQVSWVPSVRNWKFFC